MDLGFRSSLKIAEKVLRKSLYQETWGKRLGQSLPWREILHLSRATSYFLPATHNLRKIYRIKNKQGPFPGRTPVTGVITPSNYFVNSICSPSIRAASSRFQQVLFSRHTRLFSRTPFLFSRLCEPASSDATIEGSI